MQFYLKERIGNPALFTGRKRELASLLEWVEGIKKEISKSHAIISRRKTGKSALMERLFNIVFEQNDKVVPFYFEIRETDQWINDFSKKFFLTFVRQYLAFKSRNPQYLTYLNNYAQLIKASKKEKLDYLSEYIEVFQESEAGGEIDLLWDMARDAPRFTAQYYDEQVLQIIDEFQFINRHIYWDKEKQRQAADLAGSYLGTAEYKNAPLLVSGSWVGWLMRDINKMLPGRFIITSFGNIPKEEAIEMAFNYSEIIKVPVNYETACIIADITEGNPFYISSLFQSDYEYKDFSTQKGVLDTLNFETLDERGAIRGTWMEYIGSAFKEINNKNGKRIILYICKNKKVTREQMLNDLNITFTDKDADKDPDIELEKKLKAFVQSDIIEQGETNFDYRAVADNIFDKVFRGVYQKEIDGFTHDKIKNEYKLLYEKLKGKFNKYKGEFSEYVIINHLKHRCYKQNELYISLMNNIPDDFKFVNYSTVWSYTGSPVYKKNIQIDIFARSKNEYSLIGEVKNRKEKFSLKEAKEFLDKALELKKSEHIDKAVIFIFSAGGFYKNAMKFINDNSIAWSDDKRFLLLS